jgi:hypothetical protein
MENSMEKKETETEALHRLKKKYKKLRREFYQHKALITRLLFKGIIDEDYISLHGYKIYSDSNYDSDNESDDESDDEE